MNQIQRDTPLFEELSGEVTITDPTHPLYGHTLPCISHGMRNEVSEE
jgi:hypothetical protein